MEALYAKLYDKYTKLKKNKFSEIDEVNKEQEQKFLNFVTASEELMQHLRNENDNLLGVVENLRTEITSTRSTKDKECLEYQKLLVEEEQKTKVLSKEVERLKELMQEESPRNYENQSGRKRKSKTPETAQFTRRSMRKLNSQPEDMVEADMISPHSGILHKETPQYCKKNHDGSISSFQALCEHLVGMKLSTNNEGGRVSIIASHPSSGFSFSLTSVKNSAGEESVLYKVVSLGTFERVAPEWMRDDIMFSTSMYPVFFQRVSRVMKLRG